ncbi:MAG: ribosome silencing factor [Bacteroidia bacterium]
MAKKTVKKASVKKAAVKKAVTKGSRAPVKKKAVKKAVVKKKPRTEKEIQTREANAIANTEKKKSSRNTGGKSRKRVKNSSSEQTTSLLDAIVEGMQEKKARNIVVIDLTSIENRVSDYFVIGDAESKTQVEAIAGSVEEEVLKQTGEKAFHAEGYSNAEWIIIDYINIVAHVFQKETRDYYNIEGLWADAEFKEIN